MPASPKSHEHLIFAWNARDHSVWHLVAALLVLACGIAGFFFIFRVVQPVAQRAPVTPRHVIALDPRDPVALALINRAQDRSFALLGAAEGDMPEEGHAPAFRPSFDGYQIKLRELDATAATMQPRLLMAMSDVLPPVPRRATEAVTTPPAAALLAIMSPALARRGPASVELAGIPLTQPARVQFRVAVGAAGQVVTALPLGSSDDVEVMRQLQAAVSNLRFTPSEVRRLEWGEISFRWEAAARP